MVLQVSLIKSPDGLADSQPGSGVQTFDEHGGTLGRSESNTWVLPDPDRFLSSCHCEIVCDRGQYHLVDLSTNGTFYNGSPEPIGKGMRIQLADGDMFELGDYRFGVSLSIESPVKAQQGSGNSSFSNDPFNNDPFGNDPIGNDAAISFGSSYSPDVFAGEKIEDHLFNASPNPETRDPLAMLDRAHGRQDALPRGDDPIFHNRESGGRDPFDGGTATNHTPALDEALNWPDSSQQNLIPDDWEDDLLVHPEASIQARDGVLAGDHQSRKSPNDPRPTPFNSPESIAERENAPMSRPTADQALPEQTRRDPEVWGEATAPSVPMETPTPGGVRRAEPQRTHRGHSDSFIRALGMDPQTMSSEEQQAVSEMGGQMLRALVEGVMQLLRSRSTIKNEFRMNVTTIEPFENNPFKFSVGVDDALENIFIRKGKAYKEPLEAMHECFHELGEHQLAMIAGIREGFHKMMDRFDPVTLEQIFKRRGKYSSMPGLRQARCWNNYSDYYAGFADNMDSSFQSLFGSDFVQAYEDHLRQLAASRKTQTQLQGE